MKHTFSCFVYVSIFVLQFLNSPLQAQPSDCFQPISSIQFQQIQRELTIVQGQNQRYSAVERAIRNCLSTNQLIELLGFISEDIDRLTLAIAAYPKITNKQDAYDIYNSFAYFSSAFRFHDYIQSNKSHVIPIAPINPGNPDLVNPRPVEVTFPLLNYPDASLYNGPKNCITSLSENDFKMYVREIAVLKTETEKMESAISLATRTCLSTSQAMKLSTSLNIENNRLDLLKKAYLRIYDEANFDFATQVFTHIPNQSALREFLINVRKANQVVPVKPICQVNEMEFKTIKDPLAAESSSSSRLNIARDQIPRFSCYKSNQIKQLVALFSASSDKLNLAKFAFDFVADKENYFYELSPLFSSSMDRQALSNFIASKK
jgi:hypothetical protein